MGNTALIHVRSGWEVNRVGHKTAIMEVLLAFTAVVMIKLYTISSHHVATHYHVQYDE